MADWLRLRRRFCEKHNVTSRSSWSEPFRGCENELPDLRRKEEDEEGKEDEGRRKGLPYLEPKEREKRREEGRDS